MHQHMHLKAHALTDDADLKHILAAVSLPEQEPDNEFAHMTVQPLRQKSVSDFSDAELSVEIAKRKLTTAAELTDEQLLVELNKRSA